MTADQKAEWQYIYTERLGISCGDRAPTAKECERARKAADEAVREQNELDL